jgi:RNA polymerase sigma factor (TIGR02999 family)
LFSLVQTLDSQDSGHGLFEIGSASRGELVNSSVPGEATHQQRTFLMGQITQLLCKVDGGGKAARDALFAVAYAELKKLAHARLYDSGRGTTLDTTALVHELYLRFIQTAQLRAEDRRSFFAFASQVMRSVIVDAARARLAERRGGGAAEFGLSTQLLEHLAIGEESIVHVHDALLVLEEAEPRLAQVVEMRYFGGYSDAEIAEALDVNERTVRRDWGKARLLMKAALE